MERHSYDELKKEAHEVVCRRVVMLEGLLEKAMGVITKYAQEAWVSEAHETFTAVLPDFPRDHAVDIWESEIMRTTKDFNYPIPPDDADGAAQDEMSYWGD